jgi:uncharacterized SAM-binding protein YcdF (DUF218 family)
VTALALVVLGAPDDAEGVLSSRARERCDQALRVFAQHPDARGVPASAFFDVVKSGNTAEDARLCHPRVAAQGIRRLIVVTSDFHALWAQFLLSREFPDLSLEFSAAPTDLPEAELAARIAHEQGALARLRA